MLHRFRLIDRARDPGRHFLSGNIGDFNTRWANGEVLPAHFTFNDAALQQPALDIVHQVLTAPSAEDLQRRELGQEWIEENRRMPLTLENPFMTVQP